AHEPDLSAEQARDLAADGQAQARSAVAAVGAAVGLLEGLEDDLVLLRRDPDAGVLDGDREYGAGALQRVVVRAPAARRHLEGERHAAPLGELEGVREQVLEHLEETLRVGVDRLRKARVDLDREA